MLKAKDWKGNIIGSNGGNIDFIECAWNRNLKECGDFMVYLALAEYNRLNKLGLKYVENVGRPELGIVQKIEYEKETKGAFVTISGFFVDKLLDFATYRKKIVVDTSSGVKPSIVDYLSKANAAVGGIKPLGNIEFSNDSTFPLEQSCEIEEGEKAGEAIYTILSGDNYGYITSINHYPQTPTDNLDLSVKVFKGRDLTKGDSAVYFGKAFNNVSSVEYKFDDSGNQCFYEVLQDVNEEHYSKFSTTYFPIKYTEKNNGEMSYLIGCYFNWDSNAPENVGNSKPKAILKASLSSDEVDLENTTTANQKKIRNLLESKAKLDMLDNYKVEEISCNVIQERYKYLQDYDLGDKCIVYIDDLGLTYSSVITEIEETHKSNKIEIKVVLGTPRKLKRG